MDIFSEGARWRAGRERIVRWTFDSEERGGATAFAYFFLATPTGRAEPNEAAERLENVQWTFLAKELDGAQAEKE